MEADKIAAVIRRVNGDNAMGAGALAEAIVSSPEYAQVKAEAQVEALREVAKDREWLDAAARTGMNEYGGPFAGNAAKGVRDYLHGRANRIAREAGIETGEEAGA